MRRFGSVDVRIGSGNTRGHADSDLAASARNDFWSIHVYGYQHLAFIFISFQD